MYLLRDDVYVYYGLIFGIVTHFGVLPWTEELLNAFLKHVATYGGLDICINSAGISNPAVFQKDQSDGTKTWRHALNVNLVAVIECTRLAVSSDSFELVAPWFSIM